MKCMSLRRRAAVLTTAIAVAMAGLTTASADDDAGGPVRLHGYVTMDDGARIKYSVILPSATGRYPVLFEYDGYGAGSSSSVSGETKRLLDAGYAVMGANVRGTGCSSETWDLFHPQWGRDGAALVDWAGSQPWSTGKVGMYGVSFSGYMQLWVAANRPKHLAAIAPAAVVTDPYRDVGWPGGIPNRVFPSLWWGILNQTWAGVAPQAVADGDTECLQNVAKHAAFNQEQNVPLLALQHDYDDEFFQFRSANRYTDAIKTPILAIESFQDEQVSPRGGHYLDTVDPRRTWVVSTNGGHGMVGAPRFQQLRQQFFDHFLKGEKNRFGDPAMPRVELWHETTTGNQPTAVTTYPSWPVQRDAVELHLGADGALSRSAPATDGGTSSYRYPSAGSPVDYPQFRGWTAPPPPGGSLAFTTEPLAEDLTFYGEGSADLWMSTTAADTDVQVTLTEVRPDGQEMYVQRGWLRASHRALDPSRTSALRPWHPHTQDAQQPMQPGTPELLRLEINKFAHTFREGSRLRVWVEAPSQTGMWGFHSITDPSTNTVLHDAQHPSRIVLPQVSATPAVEPASCGSVLHQPCRPDPLGLPTSGP